MGHFVIVGGGAALAQPLIRHWLNDPACPDRVTAVCRTTLPEDAETRSWGLKVVKDASYVKGPIDVLVTMPGKALNHKLDDMPDAAWADVLDATLTSVYEALHDLSPKLANPSNVVVVGSIVGSTGGFGCANYAAAKSGLLGLVRAAANEWAKRGVVVNLLELGYCDLGMGARLPNAVKDKVLPSIPLGRFASAEDVVGAVKYLSRVRFMTGGVLQLSGGMR